MATVSFRLAQAVQLKEMRAVIGGNPTRREDMRCLSHFRWSKSNGSPIFKPNSTFFPEAIGIRPREGNISP
ncbi:hypothetical protein PAENIP36_49400 [Paenibacillus sp. P36]